MTDQQGHLVFCEGFNETVLRLVFKPGTRCIHAGWKSKREAMSSSSMILIVALRRGTQMDVISILSDKGHSLFSVVLSPSHLTP